MMTNEEAYKRAIKGLDMANDAQGRAYVERGEGWGNMDSADIQQHIASYLAFIFKQGPDPKEPEPGTGFELMLDFNLTSRADNCLRNLGLTTRDEVLALWLDRGPVAFLEQPNLGRKTLAEIVEKLDLPVRTWRHWPLTTP